MRQTAAGLVGLEWIHCAIAFVDHGDLTVHVDHEGGSIGDADGRIQYSVLLGELAVVVANHGEFRPEFLGPVSEGCYEVCADRQHLRVICVKFSDTRLVCCEFFRSTTGKGGGEEGEDNVLFPTEVGQFDVLPAGIHAGRNSEVGGHFPFLQVRMRRRILRKGREAERSKRQ